MRYAVVIQEVENSFSAYVPDIPGCVAAGATLMATETAIREAITFHLAKLRGGGLAAPSPLSTVEYVVVAA
jgi:predicted RNase H-like HicB family nuclease